jgi:hypothetical protein
VGNDVGWLVFAFVGVWFGLNGWPCSGDSDCSYRNGGPVKSFRQLVARICVHGVSSLEIRIALAILERLAHREPPETLVDGLLTTRNVVVRVV